MIEHDSPCRIGHDFSKCSNDISWVSGVRFIENDNQKLRLRNWGRHIEILKKVPDFNGEVMEDVVGNIYGRFEGKTKGECIKGIISDGWENLDLYSIPEIDINYYEEMKDRKYADSDKYILSSFPFSVFSNLRDARLMHNALMDTAIDTENIAKFLDKICEKSLQVIEGLSRTGCNAIIMADDWGTQDRTFISPESFREIFKPAYKVIADALHKVNMKFMLHSCGCIYEFIDDMIDAGIDVFQFDQVEVYGSEVLAREFGDRATFYSSVDIQKVLPTGNREYIEKTALEMADNFRNISRGGFIAKDYPSYNDINVKEEWADWARDVFLKNSSIN
ncbi:MAG: uroporphyrinogen decarboxylase family protein [Saccharofermentanales bacterium]